MKQEKYQMMNKKYIITHCRVTITSSIKWLKKINRARWKIRLNIILIGQIVSMKNLIGMQEEVEL